ncbi:MAG: nucleotidyltransferase domain-containing protein [Endomicrobium sp.]|jgi:predicted nucleotidyltransferase|nr:nucleotidyltransferase domain-containing protein [Endomicrobium sp.]
MNKRNKKINDYLNKVVERLKAADPYKIILFGSHAKGTAKPDSDIDLMVILDNEILTRGEENSTRDCKIIKLIYDIYYKKGMDIQIYSRAEYNYLKNRDSFFIYEIEKTGETIYEKYH